MWSCLCWQHLHKFSLLSDDKCNVFFLCNVHFWWKEWRKKWVLDGLFLLLLWQWWSVKWGPVSSLQGLETSRHGGDTVHTHILYTYKHTRLVTPEQLPPTANYCSSHMVVHLKPLSHVWIDLWCGCCSTNRQEAEFLKTAEWGRCNGTADWGCSFFMGFFFFFFQFYRLHLFEHLK